jgi:hypothetical protein
MILFVLYTTTILTIVGGDLLQSTTCVSSGRYRNRDPTCRSYYLCINSRGSLIVRNYICPETTIFNPSTNRCSVQAHCIDDVCNNLPPNVTKIADPNSIDGKSFIECVGPTDNRYPVIRTCALGYFNQDLPEPGCWLLPSCQK